MYKYLSLSLSLLKYLTGTPHTCNLHLFFSRSLSGTPLFQVSFYLYTTGTPHTYTLFLSLDNLYFTYMPSLSIFLS